MSAAAYKEPIRRVLVVEDEDAVCDLLSDILHEAGFDTVCVNSDRQAYAALSHAARYSALIVDINLGPGTTGFDVARYARHMSENLPVIYVTGQSAFSSFKAFGVPGSAFVPKPFETDDLIGQLRTLVIEA